jgi:ATP-dependent DNA helicase RecQ
MIWTEKATIIIKKYWNIDSLKDKQYEVINELLLNNDVIALLPTGYGKSMCYLLPPLVSKKVMFIISPLISLMEDQRDKLTKMGLRCSTLHSNNNNKDEEKKQILNGEIRIVYMSPEYLIKSEGLELARQLCEANKMGYLAIDEAHCISVWGPDFRPEYSEIKQFRNEFQDIPILAVTATATKTVCKDISEVLSLNNPTIIKASFDRPNLYLRFMDIPKTINKKGKPEQIRKEEISIKFIDRYPNDKIIIYANTRKITEDLSRNLNVLRPGLCDAYHAGLSKKRRDEIQSKFISGEIKVIVSTIAFGMGIDLIIRCVLIFGYPSSIEEYYQQIGRGGRDGLPCETVLFSDYGSRVIAEYMIKELKYNNPQLYQLRMNNLNKIKLLINLKGCRRKYILEHFGEKYNQSNCGNCDNCKLKMVEKKIANSDKEKKEDDFEDKINKYEKYLEKFV